MSRIAIRSQRAHEHVVVGSGNTKTQQSTGAVKKKGLEKPPAWSTARNRSSRPVPDDSIKSENPLFVAAFLASISHTVLARRDTDLIRRATFAAYCTHLRRALHDRHAASQ